MKHRGRPERCSDIAASLGERLKHPLLVISLAVLFVISVFNIDGAWSAKLGHGKYGTFTAEYELPGRGRDWFGTFVADDGTDQRRVRIDSGVSRKGQQVRAIDPGGRAVYPVDAKAWLLYTTMLLLSGGGLIAWLTWFIRVIRESGGLIAWFIRVIREIREDPWADQDQDLQRAGPRKG